MLLLKVTLLTFIAFAVALPFDDADYPDNAEPKLWALLVAGSNGYDNYRHQADVYHAYHIMINHGIPASQIIVMAYDDIANDPSNPTPGVVINHPNGKDVYKGVKIDYKGDDVTAVNFLKILTGNAAAMKGIGTGRVVASGPNDHVFVNFADHGAPGIVAFPNDELQATDLNNAIKSMFKKKQYAKMVLYFEACESGSMFAKLLPKNINAYAMTASNPDESSYACYWDDKRQTYLGDVFSVNWMEDSDKEDLKKESIKKQFTIVRKETNTSHVMQYGNVSMNAYMLSDFMGGKSGDNVFVPQVNKADAVSQKEVRVRILSDKVKKAGTLEEREYWAEQINALQKKREFVSAIVNEIATIVSRDNNHLESILSKEINDELTTRTHSCLATANKHFSKQCFSLARNEFALFTAPRVLAKACLTGVSSKSLIMAMNSVCVHQQMIGIH